MSTLEQFVRRVGTWPQVAPVWWQLVELRPRPPLSPHHSPTRPGGAPPPRAACVAQASQTAGDIRHQLRNAMHSVQHAKIHARACILCGILGREL